MTSHLEAAVAAWGRHDKALANIRLGFARLPTLSCAHDGYRLFLGERALAGGAAPAGLMRELSLTGAALTLLEYPGQPHVPAGNGRAS